MSEQFRRYSGNLPSYLLDGIDYSADESKIHTAKLDQPAVNITQSIKLKYADFAKYMTPHGKDTYEHESTHTVWIKQGENLVRVADDDLALVHAYMQKAGKTCEASMKSAKDILAIEFEELSDKAAKSYEKKGKSPKKSKEIGDAVAGMVYWKYGPGKNKKHKKGQQQGDYADCSVSCYGDAEPTFVIDGHRWGRKRDAIQYLVTSHNMSQDDAMTYLNSLEDQWYKTYEKSRDGGPEKDGIMRSYYGHGPAWILGGNIIQSSAPAARWLQETRHMKFDESIDYLIYLYNQEFPEEPITRSDPQFQYLSAIDDNNGDTKTAQQQGDYRVYREESSEFSYFIDGQEFSGPNASTNAVQYLEQSRGMNLSEAMDYLENKIPEYWMEDVFGDKPKVRLPGQKGWESTSQQQTGDKILLGRQVRDTVLKVVIGNEEFGSVHEAAKHMIDNGMNSSDAIRYIMSLPKEWSDDDALYTDEAAPEQLKAACLHTACQEIIDAFKDNPWETLVDIVDAGMKQDAELFTITEVVDDIDGNHTVPEGVIDHIMGCLKRHGKADVKRKHAGKDIDDIISNIEGKTKKAQNNYDAQSFANDLHARGVAYDSAIDEVQARFGLDYFNAEKIVHNSYDITTNTQSLYNSNTVLDDSTSKLQGVTNNGSVDSSGEIVGIPTNDNRPQFVSAQLENQPTPNFFDGFEPDPTEDEMHSYIPQKSGIDSKYDEYKVSDSDGIKEYKFPNGKIIKIINDGDDLYSVSSGDSDSDMDHTDGVSLDEVNNMLEAMLEGEPETGMESEFDTGASNITQAQLGQLINQLMNGGELGGMPGIIHVVYTDEPTGKKHEGPEHETKEHKKHELSESKSEEHEEHESPEHEAKEHKKKDDYDDDDLSSLFSGIEASEDDDDAGEDKDDDKEPDDDMFASLFTDEKSSKSSRSDDKDDEEDDDDEEEDED